VDLFGIWVPLVTPMQDGRVDLPSLRRLCTSLLDQGVHGLVACGTTGEAPLLSAEERSEVIGCVAEVAGDAVIAGAGAISTQATHDLVRQASDAGARAALVITPYFIAPTQAEIAEHFQAVAGESPIPVIIYNFPARTGTACSASTTLLLAAHPRIVGTKQSVDVIDGELQQVVVCAPEGFSIMMGAASLLWPALALGADGGILAAAHLEAPALLEIFRSAREGDLQSAAKAHRALWPLLREIEGIASLKRCLYEKRIIASPELRSPLGSA
jgi:4-hydroxy-tetrahydrodipicolinate synthase